jgi:Transport and Golgi organisation 2
MCTVSLVTTGDRLRVMASRDERHARPEATHPRTRATPYGFAIMPTDPQAGGTWIAATSSGLVFALLNGESDAPSGGMSRGLIIPSLAGCETLAEVIDRAGELCELPWPSHRLIVANRRRAVDLRLRARGLSMSEMLLGTPVMISSSSRDADSVLPARRALFQSMVVGTSDRLAAQDAFHRHRWADRADASIDMRRYDAATHSITTVDISADGVAMRYEPRRHVVGEPAWLSLPRHRVAAAPLAMVS